VGSRTWRAVLVGASFSLQVGIVAASPQVVGDEACERNAVDIASFATCEGNTVVRPAAVDAYPPPAARGASLPLAAMLAVAPPSSALARTLAAALDVGPPPAAHATTERACAAPVTLAAQVP
jgi:hypothetical protein